MLISGKIVINQLIDNNRKKTNNMNIKSNIPVKAKQQSLIHT